MRDSEGRQRHFVIQDKKDESYDSPSVRRRGIIKGREEEAEEVLEEPRAPRPRKSLREREMEEEEESRTLRRGRGKKRLKEEEDYDYEEEDEENYGSKAPKIVRVFAWVALMIILFACGYLATNYFFSWSDKKGGERIGSVYGTGSEVKESAATEETPASNTKYTLYLPDGDGFQSRGIDITGGGTREEDIAKVMSMYVDSLKETKALDPAVSINEIFQSGDWLYLNMTPSFQSSLKSLGKAKAEKLLSGFTKTVQENFPPLKKVKFYVNSKEITDKTPVDLTQPWERTN